MESKLSPTKRLTAVRLREVLSYSPETGEFIRLLPCKGCRVGDLVGSMSAHGYMRTKIDGEHHFLHHLAFLYVTSSWPRYGIDHRDGNRARNVYTNLRDVPLRVNIQNKRKAAADNKACLLGVSPSESGRWRASIGVNGKVMQLGTHDTPELAHAAYVAAKRIHHEGCTL